MVEYEVLYVDDDNIAEAIDLIDIDDMAQHIYFGPQAEILQKLNDIIKDSGEIGEFELGNLKITINSLKTYERDLIVCKK